MAEYSWLTWFALAAAAMSTGVAAAAGVIYVVWRCLWRRCPAEAAPSTERGHYTLVLRGGLPACWGGRPGAAYDAELHAGGRRLRGVADRFLPGDDGGPARAVFVVAAGTEIQALLPPGWAQLRLWWRPRPRRVSFADEDYV